MPPRRGRGHNHGPAYDAAKKRVVDNPGCKTTVLEAIQTKNLGPNGGPSWCGDLIYSAAPEIQQDPDCILAALDGNCPDALGLAPDDLKNDDNFMEKALKKSPRSVQYALDRHKNDPDWMVQVEYWYKFNKGAFPNTICEPMKYTSAELRDNTSFMLAVLKISRQGRYLEYASARLKDDAEFVKTFLELDGSMLQFASENLRNNAEVVSFAVQKSGFALYGAAEQFKSDRDVVMKAVLANGRSLMHASDELKNDREVVAAAVRNNSEALQFAPAFHNDREITLASGTVEFIPYGSPLLSDRQVVMAAVGNHQKSCQLFRVAEELKNDPEIIVKASKNPHFISWIYEFWDDEDNWRLLKARLHKIGCVLKATSMQSFPRSPESCSRPFDFADALHGSLQMEKWQRQRLGRSTSIPIESMLDEYIPAQPEIEAAIDMLELSVLIEHLVEILNRRKSEQVGSWWDFLMNCPLFRLIKREPNDRKTECPIKTKHGYPV